METTTLSLSTPIKLGIITGLIYCILIFCQNQFFYGNPVQFALIKLLFYVIILVLFVYTGILAKKESGGFISFKECLKAILVVITIAELFYIVFSSVYVKLIDPSFLEKMKAAWEAYFIEKKVPEDKISDSLKKFDDAGKISAWSLIQSYGFALIIDSLFAVIISAILKTKRPIFENLNKD
jgi:Protein of unknown function (DUF4199)